MKKELSGKRILLLIPFFFGYEISIKEKLMDMGAEVTFQDDDPSTFLSTVIETCWHFKRSGSSLIRCFENSIYKKICNTQYDIVMVINGWAITSRLVSKIKRTLLKEKGKMYLYYWDSISVLKDDEKRRRYFDAIYTFDNVDYEKHKDCMKFLPLFYCDEYYREKVSAEETVDLRTVGSYKYNRYFEIKAIIKNNPAVTVDYILYAKYIIYLHKLLRKKYSDVDVRSFVYRPLTRADIIERYSHSKAVLDIPFKGQNGLTMRTFECLAMRKKIVTSNRNIVDYDFYHPDYIYLIDTENYKLPDKDWFDKKVEISKNVIEQYSIGMWIKKIFQME